ncbi:hypothetical protein HDV06_002391 [Boothiomyces sp. JEL0866]|nr:hypothetical protein HDV06_002391 [Boothiomyces sp. JEL0866]
MGFCIDLETTRELSRGDFFKSYPAGAYTALQTIDNKLRIVQLDLHLNRLKRSSFELFHKEIDESLIIKLVQKCVAVDSFADLKIIILVYKNGDLIPTAYVEEFTPADLSPCNGRVSQNRCSQLDWLFSDKYLVSKVDAYRWIHPIKQITLPDGNIKGFPHSAMIQSLQTKLSKSLFDQAQIINK